MMVQSASGDDWSAGSARPVVDEDKWHVALAQDDVKVVSLEQLDDLFRLSIVDSETRVWQEGMSEWQPLGVVAGIEGKPAPEPKRTYPKPPSPRGSSPPAPRRAVPSPPRPANRPPVAPVSFYPQAIASASSYPEPMALVSVRPAPLGSVRPLVLSQAPPAVRRGNGFARLLVGLAALASLGVTLYRNGIVREAATSVHQESLYARLEAALGGPSFGTLRAVEQSISEQAAKLASSRADAPAGLPDGGLAKPVTMGATASTSQSVVGFIPPVVSLESLDHESASKVALEPGARLANVSTRPAAQRASQPGLESTKALKNAALAKSSPVVKTPPAGAPPTKKAKPAPVEKAASEKAESYLSERERLNAAIAHSMTSSSPSSKSGVKSKSSEYDPLNPRL